MKPNREVHYIEKCEDLEIKMSIAEMFNSMGRVCRKISNAIEQDPKGYEIGERKMGFEFKTKEKKYQLVLELKELESDQKV